jgi:hypothetical protein
MHPLTSGSTIPGEAPAGANQAPATPREVPSGPTAGTKGSALDRSEHRTRRGLGGLVEVAGFFYRHEAELARSVLAANGIDAMIVSDDTGGQGPGLQYVLGAHLMVHPGDAALARRILEEGAMPEDGAAREEGATPDDVGAAGDAAPREEAPPHPAEEVPPDPAGERPPDSGVPDTDPQ